MAEDKFKHDPEAGKDSKKLRLPFALCKAKGIAIQDWWTPSDAWKALKKGGVVDNVSDEYAEFYRELKKKRAKEYREKYPWRVKESRLRSETKKRQLASDEHTPEKNYTHIDGVIANAKKGKPMTFEQADSGNVNPYFREADKKTNVDFIGYKTNCQTCVATYIARRQGYNVRALPNLDNRDIYALSYDTSLAYIDKKGKHPEKESKPYGESVSWWLSEKVKPNDICSIEFSWKGKRNGHIIIAEKRNDGKLTLYDPQTDTQITSLLMIDKYFKRVSTNTVKLMNLSECRMDESFCDKIMKNQKAVKR